MSNVIRLHPGTRELCPQCIAAGRKPAEPRCPTEPHCQYCGQLLDTDTHGCPDKKCAWWDEL